MPKGFKVESEENMLKAVESIKPAAKKQKTSVISYKLNFSYKNINFFKIKYSIKNILAVKTPQKEKRRKRWTIRMLYRKKIRKYQVLK
jgi:hypothetical protein